MREIPLLIQAIREAIGPVEGSAPMLTSRTAGRSNLLRLFALLGFERGAEIGVWTGKFSEKICRAVPGVQLVCVDPWIPQKDYLERKNDPERLKSAYIEARDRLKPYGCQLLTVDSLKGARLVADQSLDFVYIDANHRYDFVLDDLAAWSTKVREGGIIAGHDFRTSPDRPDIEVEQAVRHFTSEHHISPWFVLAGDKTPSFFWVR
jgi:predicted O-methyltransferase YrrM